MNTAMSRDVTTGPLVSPTGQDRTGQDKPSSSSSAPTTTSQARAREAARRYFASHAISPRVAHRVGVGLDGFDLTFPGGRRRRLDRKPKVLNPKGKPLSTWWLREGTGTPLVCEGESDALAALTVLGRTPKVVGLRGLPVVCVPGTGYPADRLIEELGGCRDAFLIFDADDAGRRYGAKVGEGLARCGVRPLTVEIAEGMDLADWLVAWESVEERVSRFVELLDHWREAAPTLADWRRRWKIAELEAQLDRLKAAA